MMHWNGLWIYAIFWHARRQGEFVVRAFPEVISRTARLDDLIA
jgi:hypothetical protein